MAKRRSYVPAERDIKHAVALMVTSLVKIRVT